MLNFYYFVFDVYMLIVHINGFNVIFQSMITVSTIQIQQLFIHLPPQPFPLLAITLL